MALSENPIAYHTAGALVGYIVYPDEMETDELRRILSALRQHAANFVDAADLDTVFVQAKAIIDGLVDPDDQVVAADLCLQGPLSLFASAKAAKERGRTKLLNQSEQAMHACGTIHWHARITSTT